MFKKLVLLFLLMPALSFCQYRLIFTDSLGVNREVSYKYPLPLEIRLTPDTTKTVQFNNGVMTVPFPMKLYNDLIEITKKINKT